MPKKMPLLSVPAQGRVCWSCEHLYFSSGSPGYSEMTPGWDFEMSCGKSFWEFDSCGDGLETFRSKLLSAERCAAFELSRALAVAQSAANVVAEDLPANPKPQQTDEKS
jgi:hypothetical protein